MIDNQVKTINDNTVATTKAVVADEVVAEVVIVGLIVAVEARQGLNLVEVVEGSPKYSTMELEFSHSVQ